MEREMEKDLLEIECAIKEHKERDNTYTLSVLQRCHELVSKLKEYKDLEEQSLLIKNICKPGDEVYCIERDDKYTYEYTYTGYLFMATCGSYVIVCSRYYGLDFKEQLSKMREEAADGVLFFMHMFEYNSVFLTPSEAEEALKKMDWHN